MNRPSRQARKRHLEYLKQHQKGTYINLLTSGRLNAYLADIDKQAGDMFFRLVKEFAEKQGVKEQLKADNQLEWVRQIQTSKKSKLSLRYADRYNILRKKSLDFFLWFSIFIIRRNLSVNRSCSFIQTI